MKYTLTEIGHEHVYDFLKECSAKRKEILDAGIDTAYQTSLPTKADILLELNDGENIGGSGEYDSDWAVTDNTAEDFAYVKCRLTYGIDYFIREDTDTDENTLLCDILQKHRGHKVSIVSYGDNDVPANIALECEDCGEVILDAGIYTICARENKNMEKEKIQFIHDSLGEAKDFSKEVKDYLYKIEKLRPLTDAEKELWNKTHRIHVRMDDSRMFIQEAYADIY